MRHMGEHYYVPPNCLKYPYTAQIYGLTDFYNNAVQFIIKQNKRLKTAISKGKGNGQMAYNTSYYDKAIEDYKKKATQSANQNIADTKANYNAQLKQAYTNNMVAQRNLQNQMKTAGIRGGATETANLNLANQYNSNVGTINANKNADIQKINQNLADNIFEYTQAQNENKQAYIQQREAEDRARKQALEDAARERKWQRWDANHQEYLTELQSRAEAKYGSYTSTKKLQSAIKSLKKRASKATGNKRKDLIYRLNAARLRLQYLQDMKLQNTNTK